MNLQLLSSKFQSLISNVDFFMKFRRVYLKIIFIKTKNENFQFFAWMHIKLKKKKKKKN